jgi:hypothetical protein
MMRLVKVVVAIFLCCSLSAVSLVAQRRPPGERPETTVPVVIEMQVGGGSYTMTGQGTCTHAARASIYDVPAEQWSVRHREGSRSLALTVWRPKGGGGDMLTLAITDGSTSHRVDTVKGGRAPSVSGTGTVTLTPAEKGGTFKMDATTSSGAKISGTVRCEAFTAPIVAGGD